MHTIEAVAQQYLETLRSMLDGIRSEDLKRVADIIADAYDHGRTLFVIGNGGSASTASHMGCDLNKAAASPGRRRPHVVSLTDNMAWFSALANDLNYESVFVEQLRHLFQPGDLLIAISASGNSPNIIEAVKFVNANGGTTIGFVGFSGGQLKQLAQASIHLPCHEYGPVEDGHLVLNHLFTNFLRQHVAGARA